MKVNVTRSSLNGLNEFADSEPTDFESLSKCFDVTDSPLDSVTFRRMACFLNVCLYPMFALCGWIGSTLLIRRFKCRNKLRGRFGQHLIWLCFWDCFLLAVVMSVQFPAYVWFGHLQIYGSMSLPLYLLVPVAAVMKTSAAWQLIVLSIERLWFASHPLRSRSHQLMAVWRMSVIILVVSCVAYIPLHFTEYSLVPCVASKMVTFQVQRSGHLDSYAFSLVFNVIPSLLLEFPVPICIVATVAVLTAKHAKQAMVTTKYKRPKRDDKPSTALQSHTCEFESMMSCSTVAASSVAQMAMREGQTRRLSPRLQLSLLLLTVKYLVCNVPLMCKTFGELFIDGTFITDHEETMLHYQRMMYIDELSTAFIMLNSATNWLMFFWTSGSVANCDKSTTYPSALAQKSPSRSIYQQQSGSPPPTSVKHRTNSYLSGQAPLNPEDLRMLREALLTKEWHAFGNTLLSRAAEKFPDDTTIKQMFGTADASMSVVVGTAISAIISDILHTETNTTCNQIREIRARVRQAGQAHYRAGVHLRAEHWQLFKTCLKEQIIAAGSQQSECDSHKIRCCVDKLSNFIITELKYGYISCLGQQIAYGGAVQQCGRTLTTEKAHDYLTPKAPVQVKLGSRSLTNSCTDIDEADALAMTRRRSMLHN